MLARWKAQQFGTAKTSETGLSLPVVEEIQMVGCYGTDTAVLEADVMRAAREMAEKLAEKKNQS
jgi:hypothetical protein